MGWLPEDLDAAVRKLAERDRVSMRATLVRLVRQAVVAEIGTEALQKSHKNATEVQQKYVPPTLAEITEYVRVNRLLVDPVEFWEWYEEFGWHAKGSKKGLDWRKALHRWNRKRLKEQETGHGRKLNYAEQRIADNVRALNELFPVDGRGGGEARGPVERTDAEGEGGHVRRKPE